MKKLIFGLLFLLFSGSIALAQQTVTGTVTNAETGDPIPGVSVVVKGRTSVGTSTNMDGEYSLEVPSFARTLVYSFIGMQAKEVPIDDRTTIDVELTPAVTEMDEVVVTALGVSRQRKSLGYGVEDVQSEEITRVPQANMLSSLSGKTAGLEVRNATGGVSSSTRITIRGNSVLSGNNQPLFVVDGTPISNYTTDVSQWGEADFGNAAMDLNPEDIESISVLKGASASALYGSRAMNGVILITTKSGKTQEGIGVDYSYSVDFSRPYILPDYQDKYGQGVSGSEFWAKQEGVDPNNLDAYNEYALNNSYAYYNGIGGGVYDYFDESWGPRLDIGLQLPQFNSPYTLDENGLPVYEHTPWVSHPNNVENFFETGISDKHNLALSGGTDYMNGRFSLARESRAGTVPNTDLTKTSLNFSGSLKLTEKLTAGVKSTYINNHSDNLPYGGYSANNVMQSIGGWFGRQVDMKDLEKNWQKKDAFGKPYTWSYYYHDNPYWTVHRKPTSRTRDRVFGNANLNYQLADWLNVTGRLGTDYWTEKREHQVAAQSNSTKTTGGSFWQQKRTLQLTNIDLLLNFNQAVTNNFQISGILGARYFKRDFNYSEIEASELTVDNLFTIGNVAGNPSASMDREESERNSIFGEINFSYNDFLFLGVTGRNDWSSTLPPENWSYFYPSANIGFVFSELTDLGVLSFGKLRASYAQVGNTADPYSLQTTYSSSANTFKGQTQYYFARTLANSELKPERKTAYEAGVELNFFSNRLGVDVSYYNNITTDQIMEVELIASTGVTGKWINAGEIENEGIEISAFGDIFQSQNGFNWRMRLNWGKNNNTVNKLTSGLDKIQINSSWGGVVTEAQPGKPMGVIKATDYYRDDQGRIVVDEDGFPQTADNPSNQGNITPDWTAGMTNTFSYKGLNLSVLVDGRKGGDFFSVTKMFGLYAGVLDETAKGDTRVNGIIGGKNIYTDETWVKEDGSVNDIAVDPQSFWSRYYGVKAASVIDGSYIKLREISLGYTLPETILPGFLQRATLSAYVHNAAILWMHESNDIPIDPETSYGATLEGQGFEQFQLPPNRSIGLKVDLKF